MPRMKSPRPPTNNGAMGVPVSGSGVLVETAYAVSVAVGAATGVPSRTCATAA